MAEPTTTRTTALEGALGLEWTKINNDPAKLCYRGRTLLRGYPADVAATVVFTGVPIACAVLVTYNYPLVVAGVCFGGGTGASFSTGHRIKKDAEGTVLSTRDIRMPLVARVGFPTAMGALAFTAPSTPMLVTAAVAGVYGYFIGNTYRDVTQGPSTTPESEKTE